MFLIAICFQHLMEIWNFFSIEISSISVSNMNKHLKLHLEIRFYRSLMKTAEKEFRFVEKTDLWVLLTFDIYKRYSIYFSISKSSIKMLSVVKVFVRALTRLTALTWAHNNVKIMVGESFEIKHSIYLRTAAFSMSGHDAIAFSSTIEDGPTPASALYAANPKTSDRKRSPAESRGQYASPQPQKDESCFTRNKYKKFKYETILVFWILYVQKRMLFFYPRRFSETVHIASNEKVCALQRDFTPLYRRTGILCFSVGKKTTPDIFQSPLSLFAYGFGSVGELLI